MKFKITLSRKIIFSEGLLGNICLPGMLDFQYSDINIKRILGHHDLNYFDSWAWTGRVSVNWRTWPWCWNTWLIESASTSITSKTKNLKTQKIQTAILQKAQGWFLLGKKAPQPYSLMIQITLTWKFWLDGRCHQMKNPPPWPWSSLESRRVRWIYCNQKAAG